MGSTEWSLPDAFDVLASAAPDRDMLVWRDTRRTYAEVAARTRNLAAFFARRGIGAHRERSELARWECGQASVALLLYNCPEYIEAMYGCFRARAVPFNVNQHYRPEEIRRLLEMLGAEAVVYHRALAPLVEAAGAQRLVLVDVEDGSGVAPLANSTGFEQAAAERAAASPPVPTPDDLYLVCTGGTTGSPKAVLWRQGDIFASAMGGGDAATRESITATAAAGAGGTWFAAPPLMHAASQWTAFAGLHSGATIVLHDDRAPFDASAILDTVVRERVTFMSIVGDAFARRLIDELRAKPYDLSSLKTLGTGGAVTSQACKDALFELIPDITIVDGYGASETGGMAFGATRRGVRLHGFAPREGAAVLSADRRRFLAPGNDEVGWTARRGRVPLGYLGDAKKTEDTFPIIDGERVAVPGDRARLDSDGTIVLLGRDSLVVNSGGEKIFVEEVEEVLRQHAGVVDALVVGRPSERFGEEVVGIVQLRPDVKLEPYELREFIARSIARFKAPRAIAFCDRIHRHASGKGDYRWARAVAERAVLATARPGS